jgi:hypothetical protein
MNISLEAANGWLLREPPFPFQQTYVTPLTDLPRFVKAILAPFEFIEGEVWMEQIVFEPKELIWYLRGRGVICNEGQLHKAVLNVDNKVEAAELLECVLGQWTDFAFIPSPKNFVIYAGSRRIHNHLRLKYRDLSFTSFGYESSRIQSS